MAQSGVHSRQIGGGDSGFIGTVTSDGSRGALENIRGVLFEADMETEFGSGRVRFVVPVHDLEEGPFPGVWI